MNAQAIIDFVNYFIFSSLEYTSVMFMIFSIFNINVKHYKVELILIITIITLLSYFLVIVKISDHIPFPLIFIPIITITLKFITSRKLLYTLSIVTSGFVFYGLIQVSVVLLFIYMGNVSTDDLQVTFSSQSYVIQAISSMIGLAISMHVVRNSTGFGFDLRHRGKYYLSFSIFPVTFVLLYALIFVVFFKLNSVLLLLSLLIISALGTVIILYFSMKRDNFEYR